MVSQAMRQRPQQLNQAQMKCVLIRGDVLYNSRSARSLSSLSIIYTCWSLIRSDCTHCTVGGNLSLPPPQGHGGYTTMVDALSADTLAAHSALNSERSRGAFEVN
jgi:hypothetical protein